MICTYKIRATRPRDLESNLDYFGARYLSSQWGRWMTADWTAGASAVPYANLTNPQSLNLYAYVGNDPIDGQDPTGHSRYQNPYLSMSSAGGQYDDQASLELQDEAIYGNDIATTHGKAAYSADMNWTGLIPASGAGDQNGRTAVQPSAQQTTQAGHQQQPADNPSSLRLVPESDDGHDHSDDRNIVYEVVTTSGDYPTGDWYVTEHQTNPNFNGTTNGMSGGNELNQFSDEIYPSIGADSKVGTKSIQTFTISPNQGKNAQPSYSITVRIQGKDYGALGIYVIPGGSRVNGMLNLLKGQ